MLKKTRSNRKRKTEDNTLEKQPKESRHPRWMVLYWVFGLE